MTVPVLSDLEDSTRMWGEAQVTRFIGGAPSSAADCWSRLLRYAGHWTLLGFGYWTVRDRASGAFVGEVGFGDFRRGLGPAFDGAPEMGWALSPAAQGQGYAREAVAAALVWADSHGWPRTVCMIDQGNAASVRVAEASGFQRFGQAEFKGEQVGLFERAAA